MKKLVISLLSVCMLSPALAHHGRPHYSEPNHAINHYPFNRNHNHDWVAPVVIITGAVIATEISRREREARELARQEQIIRNHDRINNIPVAPPSRTIIIERQSQVCSEWREVQDMDGKIYRERVCRSE